MISKKWRRAGGVLDSIAIVLFIANVIISVCNGNFSAFIGWTMAVSFLVKSMIVAGDSRYWYEKYCSSIGIFPES